MQNERRLPVGVSDFQALIKEKYQFADKSLFVKEILNDGAKVILITRPRRFGKTLNLSMLYHFLQETHAQDENLFENLAISKEVNFCKEHQQQYPVIFISFKDIKKSSFIEAYNMIAMLISDLYKMHLYLLEGNVLHESNKELFNNIVKEKATALHIEAAIKQLSMHMEKKFKKKPIILIDEYDTPIQEAYLRGYYQDMIDFMRSLFGQSLKDNTALGKAVLTGITRVSQESLFSGLNNLEIYSLLRENYGQYFGFTEPEVTKLIEDTGQEIPISSIKEWYNGYQVGKYVLYNPWSIINCLKNHGKLSQYWVHTASNDLIKELVTKADDTVKQEFELLLQGKTIEKPLLENLVFTELEDKEEALWSLLLYAGYLNVLSTKATGFELLAQVSIPNREVMHVYDEMVVGWFRKGASLSLYKKFIQSLTLGNIDTFKKYLSEYIMEAGSFFDFNKNTPEKVFHSFMLGLVVGLKEDYVIQSNQESGLGRFDVVFIPKDKRGRGILLEFKTSNTEELMLSKAQEALVQIKDKQYVQLLKQHEVASVLAIGLAFCGKQVELAHETVNVQDFLYGNTD